jgi:hypothetical protein
VSRYDDLAGMARAYWDYALRHPNRYEVIACRLPEAEQPPTDVKFQVTEPLHDLVARLAPDNPLTAARVIWSYLHGAVSLRLAWPARQGLDPDEAFMAGVAVLETWLKEAYGGGPVD